MSYSILKPTTLALLAGWLLCAPYTAHAYVGPGAGFAFVSSFFILIFTTFLALLTLLTWPLRWVAQRIRGRAALAASRVRRVVVLGLDGQDPELTEQFMKEGALPNFCAPARARRLPSPPDDAAGGIARGVDVVSDRL